MLPSLLNPPFRIDRSLPKYWSLLSSSCLMILQSNATHFSVLFRYAGYCPRAKFLYYGDTFGNTTAKCFQDRRTAKLSTSITHDPGISADGQHRFPTVYSNTPDLVLSARARTRERWRNAKKYSLFNEHQRGREVQEFDKVLLLPQLTWVDNTNRHSLNTYLRFEH